MLVNYNTESKHIYSSYHMLTGILSAFHILTQSSQRPYVIGTLLIPIL